MRPINRPAPVLPVNQMQTYAIKSPKPTHFRPATCEEVDCKHWREGWVTTVPRDSPQADMLRQVLLGRSPDGIKRKAVETTELGSANVSYYFEAGQKCFRQTTHTKRLDRPEFYLVRGGDWRANTGMVRRHDKAEHWVEDMSETLEAVRRKYT